MLAITVLGQENFNEETQQFTYPYAFVLHLEYSLVSLSKWESEFKKPFLGKGEKTIEETLAFIHAMIVTPGVPRDVLELLSEENFKEIHDYMQDPMTATWFSDVQPETKNSEVITNELIYYWMDMFGISRESENWHLNRLFTLIQIHNLKNQKPKKMSRAEVYERNRKLNEQRRAQLGTSG